MINIQGCFGFYNDGIQISRQDNLMKDILFLYCNMESITFLYRIVMVQKFQWYIKTPKIVLNRILFAFL